MPTNDQLSAPPSATLPAKTWYAVNRASPKEAEILIYEEIGSWGITAEAFVKDLKDITADRINVRLNTPGGEVFDGTAIHNALTAHPAEIIVHIDGVAASAGSFIAMSGDEIHMADNAYMMIHNSRGGVMGEADEMHTYAETLEKIDGNIAQMYADQSGKPAKHYRELMDAETWFTAEEALAEGLIDSITVSPKKEQDPAKSACVSFKVYNLAKVPEPVKRLWGIQPETQAPEASPRGEPSQTPTEEKPLMADTAIVTAPAPSPAAPNPATTQDNPPIVDGSAQSLNAQAIQASHERGRQEGRREMKAEEDARLVAILAACPGKADMVIDAFRANQSAAAVKMAFDAAAKVEAQANVRIEALQRENAKQLALATIGGYPGGVAMDFQDEDAPAIDPKLQAEQEWDRKPAVRKGFSSKERYVAFRTAELSGKFHMATARAE